MDATLVTRARSAAFALLFVTSAFGGCTVIGFCAGGLLGPHLFGSHGLADLAYLFGGGFIGAVIGLGVAVWGFVGWSPRRRLQVAIALLAVAAFAAGVVVVADMLDTW